MIRATRSVTEATARAAGAASSMQQEQVIAAANLARQAVGELLNTTRAAAQNAENAELKYKTLNAGREVALQVKQLLSTLYFLLSRPDDRQAKNALLTASREVAKVSSKVRLVVCHTTNFRQWVTWRNAANSFARTHGRMARTLPLWPRTSCSVQPALSKRRLSSLPIFARVRCTLPT